MIGAKGCVRAYIFGVVKHDFTPKYTFVPMRPPGPTLICKHDLVCVRQGHSHISRQCQADLSCLVHLTLFSVAVLRPASIVKYTNYEDWDLFLLNSNHCFHTSQVKTSVRINTVIVINSYLP